MTAVINFDNYDQPLDFNLEKLQRRLAGLTEVEPVRHRFSERFNLLFRESYFDIVFEGSQNRSTWTIHTAISIKTAAQALGLKCIFETKGRLDAVIEGYDEGPPGVILVAEWESIADSVFGENGELEKLWRNANKHKEADAFLLTYCPVEKYMTFTRDVVAFWQGKQLQRRERPSLFLHVIVSRRYEYDEYILFRTIEITSSSVALWHDLPFVEIEEYEACIRRM